MKKKQKILVIIGPTSSGKSALAVELARHFTGEVISADSRQVYKGLNIGTGKITRREMKGVRHHFLGVTSAKKIFTAHDFVEKARAAIEDISRRGKLPIIAGGTGFYIDALMGRILLPNVPADQKLRARLEEISIPKLFVMLKKRDPRRAKTIEPHNKRRLIRALEIAAVLGHTPVAKDGPLYRAIWIGLYIPLKQLEEKITLRITARMRQGMLEEAKRLYAAGVSYKRMEQLGLEYRALARYLQGKITRTQMIDELNRDIRRYAKKQLAYWKRNKEIQWFDPVQKKKIFELVRNWRKDKRALPRRS